MKVSDPRKVAGELQSWITSTDPKATSAGMNVEQSGDNDAQYTVAMTFSVQAALYPQIQRYLADYAGQHGGKLLLLHESVQDVTNDYVDTQSRLANLRTEQQRLQALIDRKSTRLNSSHANISYAVLCLKKKQQYLFWRGPIPRGSARCHAPARAIGDDSARAAAG